MIVVRINNRRAHQTQFGYYASVCMPAHKVDVRSVGRAVASDILGDSYQRFLRDQEAYQRRLIRRGNDGNPIVLPDSSAMAHAYSLAVETSAGSRTGDHEGRRGT